MTLDTIVQQIESVLDKARSPFPDIPAFLLACAAINRPGLSAMLLTANVLSRKNEYGDTSSANLADGSANTWDIFTRVIVEETIKHFRDNCKVQVSIPIGKVFSTGTVQTSTGVGTANVTNAFPINLSGILS